MAPASAAVAAIPAWVVLGSLEFVVLFGFTVALVRFYSAKHTPWYANVLVFVSWYLGFFGTLFLPIDIAEAYSSIYDATTNVTNVTGGARWPPVDAWATPSATPLAPNASLASSSFAASATPTVSALSPTPLVFTVSPTPTQSQLVVVTATATPSGTPPVSGTPTVSPSSSGTPSGTPAASATPSSSTSPGSPPSASQTPTPTTTASRSKSPVAVSASLTPSTSKSPSRSHIMTRTPSQTPAPLCEPNCAPLGRLLQGTNASTPGAGGLPALLPGNGSGTGAPLGSWQLVTVTTQRRNTTLESMWVAVYWITFFLTYVLIPVVQEYIAAGEFTRRGRFMASLKINIIFYAAMGSLAFGALAYVVVGLNQGLTDVNPVLITLANSMGLVIIVLLLGYGTAEVPRAIWNESDAASDLRRSYFSAPELDSVLFDVRGTLVDLLKKLLEFEQNLAKLAADRAALEKNPRFNSLLPELQRCFGVVQRKADFARALLGPSAAPKRETPEQAKRRMALEKKFAEQAAEDEEEAKAAAKSSGGGWFSLSSYGLGSSDKYKNVTLHNLAKLHKRLMAEIASLQKAQYRFDSLVTRCMLLEYVVAGQAPPIPSKHKTVEGKTYYLAPKGLGLGAVAGGSARNAKAAKPSSVPRQTVFTSKELAASATSGVPMSDAENDVLSERAGLALLSMHFLPHFCGGFLNVASWHFRIHYVPFVYKVVWLFCELLSLTLLWSEATIFLNLTGLVGPNLSLFGLFLHWADEQGSHSYAAIQLAALFPLAYMCLCSTFTVFQLKLSFLGMDLLGHQNTDPYAMLVCASLFNRLQFSLAFNYLNVLMHSTNRDDYPPTAFLRSVGARMDLSVIDWYLPLGMIAIYAMCKLNSFNRLLGLIGVEAPGDPLRGNVEHDSIILTGQSVVSKGKRTLGLAAGVDGMSEEDFEKADEASRNRLKNIMMRAQMRKEGRDPDAPEGAAATAPVASGAYSSGGIASGVAVASMNDFAGPAGKGAGLGSESAAAAAGAKAGGAKGLAALAARASLGALSVARGALVTATGGSAPAPDSGIGATIDFDDAEDAGDGGGDGGRSDEWQSRASVDFSNARYGSGAFVAPQPILEPPTMSELLKGKRKL